MKTMISSWLLSQQNDTVLTALNKLVYDPVDQVRNTLLNLCKESYLPAEIAANIIKTLRNDNNYTIRKYAQQKT